MDKIIAMIGSTRFKEDHDKETIRLLREGYNPIPLLYSDMICDEFDQVHLDRHIRRMIDIADEVFVVNRFGYVGRQTLAELQYTTHLNKLINYMVPIYYKEKSLFAVYYIIEGHTMFMGCILADSEESACLDMVRLKLRESDDYLRRTADDEIYVGSAKLKATQIIDYCDLTKLKNFGEDV